MFFKSLTCHTVTLFAISLLITCGEADNPQREIAPININDCKAVCQLDATCNNYDQDKLDECTNLCEQTPDGIALFNCNERNACVIKASEIAEAENLSLEEKCAFMEKNCLPIKCL